LEAHDGANLVAELKTELNTWHERCEVDQVVHDQHHDALIEDFITVFFFRDEGSDAAKDDDLSDDGESHQRDLPDDSVTQEHHDHCKYQPTIKEPERLKQNHLTVAKVQIHVELLVLILHAFQPQV